MDEKRRFLKKLYWSDVCHEVKKVNPILASIIDDISPDKQYPLIKASYVFGDSIINNGITYLPSINNRLVPISDPNLQKFLTDCLSYSSIPLFLILQKANEVFINSSARSIPLNMFYPGSLLGLFEACDFLTGRKSNTRWCVSAGARNIFALPRLNETGGFKRLKMAYGLNANIQPRSLFDHWRVFYEIARHESFGQEWQNDILFFSRAWLTNHLKDQRWHSFKDYLFQNAWHQAQFAISKVGFNLNWEYFSETIASRHLRPTPYLTDQIKHILLIAANRWPGFRTADLSDQVAPVLGLQKVITDIYKLKKYTPTFMHPCNLEHDGHYPRYYSLSYPTLIEGTPENRYSSTIMLDIRAIKHIMDTIAPILHDPDKIGSDIFNQIRFDYFHVEHDNYNEIKASHLLKAIDKEYFSNSNHFPDREFCASSQFWRGCIRIAA